MHFLVQSQLWIALGAFSLTLHTDQTLGRPPGPCLPVPLLVFGATLSTYALLQWRSQHKNLRFQGHWSLVWALLILWGISMVFRETAKLPAPAMIVLGSAFVLALGYTFPLPGTGRSLRQWPYAKVFLIAAVWTMATAWLPFMALHPETGWTLPALESLTLFLAARFLFIVAITLPFDLRDQEADRREGILTLPMRLGWPATRRIALAALGMSLAATLAFSMPLSSSGTALWPILAMHGAAGLLILKTHGERSALYYGFWLDGVLVIPLAMTGISALFHR